MEAEARAIASADSVLSAVRKGRNGELTLHNGIKLLCKPVPPLLLQAIGKRYTPPPPPKVFIEEKGRDEENPNDPAYLKQLEELEEEQNLAVQSLVLGAGTELISVPEGYFRPEDQGWIDKVEFTTELAGIKLNLDTSSEVKKYICWLRYYALETASDAALAEALPLQLAGIREGEIQEALEGFHGIQGRRTDTQSPSETGDQDGDSANRAARRNSSRNRRTRSSTV